MMCNDLMQIAKKISENAYCVYSKYKIGSSLISEKGNVYSAANVENASYPLCSCAERNVIYKGISEEGPTFKIKALACYT